MKKLMIVAMVALASVVFAQEAKTMSLADARGQIAEAVASADKMAEIMNQLSPEDQVTFLAAVNAAIDSMPGSGDQKAAAFVSINEAAMRANKGNLPQLLAETYATVPTEALTVVNERFAADLFSRSADPSNPISDEDFKASVLATMKTIQERVASTDESGVRSTFAILTFLRASAGTPADLKDALVAQLPDAETRDLAKNEWIPAAMAEGADKTYEPMLGASDGGTAPSMSNVLAIAPSQVMSALLSDLGSKKTPFLDAVRPADGLGSLGLPENSDFEAGIGVERIPRSTNKAAPFYPGYRRGQEPDTYPFQGL